ncbi:ATP-binding protein [Chitinophaga nivalis]|uniref:histidine kinase n=1 Tax=Chitinophaga nivalis TaxID=2991709 RepID=A0ABT3IIU0_9BACT|nr:ATP-binding protein [Chitinophaga nivalis]MCW3466579.1 ATP-binding protein [Chitinophaga nivalis]MCW3483730.1 ATP-binding protein [Chitinophaga nivalis]
MSKIYERKTFVRYAALISMVIILMTFFMIIFLRKRASEQLSTVVKHLVTIKTDAGHIDRAVQLLYAADNNFRLYTLTYDKQYLNTYIHQLKAIAAHVDTAVGKETSQQQLQNLMADKAEKTQLFIRGKQYIDSLLHLSLQWDTTAMAPGPQLSNIVVTRQRPADTIIMAAPTPVKQKKLFGRLKDAISNKTPKNNPQQTQIIKYGKPSEQTVQAMNKAQLQQIQEAYQRFIRETASGHANLNRKEYALIIANQRLFTELEHMLAGIKQSMLDETDKKRWELSRDIDHSLNSIDQHSIWEVPLILLLAGIIIYGIFRLYRYDLALFRAKQQAEKFARQKSDFVATMSHEIRTPVQSLLGYASMLEAEQQGETVSAIRHSAEMLLSVVNNVLDYTRMETDRPILRQDKFSPRTAIEEVCNSLRIQADMKSLTLVCNIYFPTTLQVIGDAFRLKQVVINLVANAIKFTHKGTVTITAHVRDGNQLQVSVKDTGVGISPTELPLIFDPFAQGDQGFHKGSGLGLHISRKIIDLHQGNIRVESLPGRGSTFYFDIRYQVVQQSPATKKITLPVSNTPTAATIPADTRLLVVEDSILNQKLLAFMLDRLQASYRIVSSAEEALQIFKAETFDIILTDIDLPGMDGIMLTHEIRQLPDRQKAAVAIIAISGNVLEDDIALYLRSGLNDCIMKPYREEDILEKVMAHRQNSEGIPH